MARRTVSASARARVQSSERTAAVAAEFFSSVLREVGMAFLPKLYRRFNDCHFLLFDQVFRGMRRKVNQDDRHTPPTVIIETRIVSLCVNALIVQTIDAVN